MNDAERRWAAILAVAATLVGLAATGVAVDRSGLLDPSDGGGQPTAAPTATAAAESVDEQLRRVARTVEQLRELAFDALPDPTYLSPEELAERAGDLLAEYGEEDAERDRILLSALGAVPSDADLRTLLRSAIEQQLAGFYDQETGELVVGTSVTQGRLSPLDELTLAHELQHALADQVLGLPEQGEVPDGEEDRAFAVRALIEGDATLTMLRYAERELTFLDRARIQAEQERLTQDSGRPPELPHFVERSLSFPYQEGGAFVAAIHASGGWARVDAAYAEPPGTTLEVLQPDRYLAGGSAAEHPRELGSPGAGWTPGGQAAVGAADLLFLFEAPGGDTARRLDDPLASAVTWRGGQARLWSRHGAHAVGVALVGRPGLCEAVIAWYRAAFPSAGFADRPDGLAAGGGDRDTRIRCDADQVRLGVAPDARTAEAIVR